MPMLDASNCGNRPVVCRLFPLHPGYVITVCAAAVLHVAATASIADNRGILLACALRV